LTGNIKVAGAVGGPFTATFSNNTDSFLFFTATSGLITYLTATTAIITLPSVAGGQLIYAWDEIKGATNTQGSVGGIVLKPEPARGWRWQPTTPPPSKASPMLEHREISWGLGERLHLLSLLPPSFPITITDAGLDPNLTLLDTVTVDPEHHWPPTVGRLKVKSLSTTQRWAGIGAGGGGGVRRASEEKRRRDLHFEPPKVGAMMLRSTGHRVQRRLKLVSRPASVM